ncbi:hypothetical protein BDV19DRAFT_364554 [Aspergillus venezuelensis]
MSGRPRRGGQPACECYLTYPPNGKELAGLMSRVADVARILDEAGIGSILFGWQAMALTRGDMNFKEVDFVVHEDKLDSAEIALKKKGFTLCTDPRCSELCVDRAPKNLFDHWAGLPYEERVMGPSQYAAIVALDRWHPIAAAYYHIADRYPQYSILALHRRSYLLWWLTEIQLGPPADGDRNIMLTTDDRLSMENQRSGPWTELYPIKTLAPWVYVETLILLWCRDFEHPEELSNVWDHMLIVLSDVDQWEINVNIGNDYWASWDGIMDRGPLERMLSDETSPPFRENPWKKGVKGLPLERQNIWVQTKQLRAKLMKQNKLPFPPVPKAEP